MLARVGLKAAKCWRLKKLLNGNVYSLSLEERFTGKGPNVTSEYVAIYLCVAITGTDTLKKSNPHS